MKCVAHGDAEELVEDHTAETLNEAIGFRCPDLGAPMLDDVEVEVKLSGMPLGPAELASAIGEHISDRQVKGSR